MKAYAVSVVIKKMKMGILLIIQSCRDAILREKPMKKL